MEERNKKSLSHPFWRLSPRVKSTGPAYWLGQNQLHGGDKTSLAPATSTGPTERSATPIAYWPQQLPGSSFVGRTSLLEALHAEYITAVRDGWGVRTQMLSGVAGAGKTYTVLEYARRYREEYTHLLWADASDPERLAASFGEFAVAMGIPESERAGTHQLVAAVWQWLHTHERWLLVFDGATEMLNDNWRVGWTGEHFLKAHPDSRGHVLITTRSAKLHPGGTILHYQLGDLPEHEAARLLLHLAGLIPLDTAKATVALLVQEKLPEEECAAIFALLEKV